MVDSITPVHSLWLVSPQRSCGVVSARWPPKLPEHSRKHVRVVAGKRHHPVHEKTICVRIDHGDAGVMALVVEIRRRDRPVEILERSAGARW